MNNNINLCKILNGLEGIELYSSLTGENVFLKEITESGILKLEDKLHINIISFTNSGASVIYPDGECLLFPSKEQRNWNKFIKPLPIDTPMMCCNIDVRAEYDFRLRYYAEAKNKKHYCFDSGRRSVNGGQTSAWDVMIPLSDFNPNDMEENFKNNIQRFK